MGLFNSRPETPTMPPFVEHHSSPMMSNAQPYPDMNVIFKGIPKVMQVADDMHRMTNYIEDMRNMFFGCSVVTVLGILVFVLLKCMKKQKRRGRRFIHHIDSEQSSISRNGAGGGGGHYRHFSRHLSNGDWAHKIVDMSDQGNPPQTTSTTNTGTIGTVSRHTPPIHNRYGVAHNSAVHPSHLPPQTAHQPMGHPQGPQQQQTPQDYQSSSQHSALSGNFVANGNGGGGGALGMKVNPSGNGAGNKPNGVHGASGNHVVVEKRKIAD